MSIHKIGIKALRRRDFDPVACVVMILSFVVPAILNFFYDFLVRDDFLAILATLLGVNGSILGLVIAGFSIASVIPKDILIFMISTKAEDHGVSYFKAMLNNYAICFMALFTSLAVYTCLYGFATVNIQPVVSDLVVKCINSFLYGLVWLVQAWVVLELKEFLFWIYDNSLMIAESVAQSENTVPLNDDDLSN